jgi:hypothetical protein
VKTNLALSLAIIVLLALLYYAKFTEEKVVRTRIFRDTLYIDSVIYRDRLKVRTKTNVVYDTNLVEVKVRDTTIKVYPFTACIDTIVKDTIKVCFSYPDSITTIDVRYKSDTVKITKFIEKEVECNDKPSRWYQSDLAKGLGIGLVATILIEWLR